MGVTQDIAGSALIAASLVSIGMQLHYRRHVTVRQALTAPRGFPVRVAVFSIGTGTNLITGPVWAVTALLIAMVAWEAAVRATAQVRRVRHSRS